MKKVIITGNSKTNKSTLIKLLCNFEDESLNNRHLDKFSINEKNHMSDLGILLDMNLENYHPTLGCDIFIYRKKINEKSLNFNIYDIAGDIRFIGSNITDIYKYTDITIILTGGDEINNNIISGNKSNIERELEIKNYSPNSKFYHLHNPSINDLIQLLYLNS